MNTSETGNRNYASISPSAKVLLLMKGHTGIPFARQAAALISKPDTFTPDFERKDFAYWARVVHFESRYQQVNALLADIDTPRMLELSSGFSFRGLQLTQEQNIHFIDTDLPDLITAKTQILSELQAGLPAPRGRLETLPLNAMDGQAFGRVTARFADGPLTIVNEGLLMYLNLEEKKKLCRIIREELSRRGGYWITADIYLRKVDGQTTRATLDDDLQRFLDEHRIEENKFETPEAAEAFFNEQGFVIDKAAEPDYTQVGSVERLLAAIPPDKLEVFRQNRHRIQATWRLKPAG